MVTIPFPTTITVVTQTMDVRTGDRAAGSSTDVTGCVTWQAPGTEAVAGEDTVVYDVTVLAPPGTVVDPTDRVELGGQLYEVVGEPIVWEHPLTGSKPGVEIHLRRVIG